MNVLLSCGALECYTHRITCYTSRISSHFADNANALTLQELRASHADFRSSNIRFVYADFIVRIITQKHPYRGSHLFYHS